MILFIGHEASRTGAPKVLYDFLAWLKTNEPKIQAQVLLGKGGDYADAFAGLYPTEVWKLPYPETINLAQRIDNKLFNTFYKNQQKYIRRFEKQDVKIIFSNTCTNGSLLEHLEYLKCPLITFVHEMEGVIQIFNQNGHVSRQLERSTHLIVPSLATKQSLIKYHGTEQNKITVCYNGIDPTFAEKTAGENLREKWNIPANAFVVGACGTIEARKSPEHFIQTAQKLGKEKDIHFIWAGRFLSANDEFRLRHQLEILGLQNNFHFVGSISDMPSFYNSIDVLATLSQEDPFPLVNLEAGIFAKPIICFENAGGTPELLTNGAGFILPFLDTDSVARTVLMLKNQPEMAAETGRILAEKIKSNFNSEQTLKKLWQITQKQI